jgi:hypothetical protein
MTSPSPKPFLAILSLEIHFEDDGMVGYGLPGGRPQFLLVQPFDRREPSVGNGSMIALLASRRTLVDACHAAAMEQAGRMKARRA